MFSDFSVSTGLFQKACIILSISILFGLFVPSDVFAEELKPSCSKASLINDTNPNTFLVKLDCINLKSFYSGEMSLTQDFELMKINLETASGVLTPLRADIDIDNSQIKLTFYTWDDKDKYYDLSTRSLTINSGLILNTVETNDQIYLAKLNIIDGIPPNSQVEDYFVDGLSLNVAAQDGVLKNDKEMQSPNVTVVLVENVQSGVLILNTDGSFSFTPPQTSDWSDVFFKYQVIDGSDNTGNVAKVTLHNAPPTIKTEFYTVCGDSCIKKIAKNGDTVKVKVTSSKPIVLSDMVIAEQDIADYITIDTLSYYFIYTLGPVPVPDGEIHYSFDYTYANITKSYDNLEDPVIIDNTPPIVDLGDDDYIELYTGDIYEEPATGSDTTSAGLPIGDLPVDVVGFFDISRSGFYYLYFTSTDEAGNVSEVVQKTIHVIDMIAINQIDNFKRGENLIINGYIDDVTKSISLDIDGIEFEVPTDNIVNNNWYVRFNTDNFKLGKNIITATAFDEFDNRWSYKSSFVVNQHPTLPVNRNTTVIPVMNYFNYEYVDDSSKPNNDAPIEIYQDVIVEIAKPIDKVIDWKLFGIDWYYWLIMSSLLGFLLFWIFGK